MPQVVTSGSPSRFDLDPQPTPQIGSFRLVSDLVEERTEKILKKLISQYHSVNGLSLEEAHSGIATIAGLRLLLSDLRERLRLPKD